MVNKKDLIELQHKPASLWSKLKNQHTLSILAILTCTVLWGLSFISAKSLLIAGLTPIQVNSARFIPATLVFLILYLADHSLRLGSAERSDVNPKPQHSTRDPGHTWHFPVKAGLAAIMGIPVYFLLETMGLHLTSAGTASLITGLSPIINAIALLIFLRVSIVCIQWAGIIMSCFGVYVVAQADISLSLSQTAMLGNSLVFLSACSWVAYTIMNKPLVEEYDNLTLNTYQHLVGTAILWLIAFLKEGIPHAKWNLMIWANILYLGVFCSALAFFLYLFALKNLSSTVITSFINLVPFVSVLGARVFLGEPVSWIKLLGGILTVIGVYLVSSQDVPSTQETCAEARQDHNGRMVSQ
jgi:drug/metabolite transporter (DMT)-like permease